jgi:hypothetical protein
MESRLTYGSKTSWEVECRDISDDLHCGTVIDPILRQILQFLCHVAELLRYISKLVINLCSLQAVVQSQCITDLRTGQSQLRK